MKVNNYYRKSIGGELKDFIDFIKVNTVNLEKTDIKDIDFLVQRIAQNLFYFEDNLSTAKSDYISLIGLLMKKGVIFESELNAKKEDTIKERLEYLRGELRAERISTGELIELQSLAEHINAGDVELLEAAGVPEQIKK